MTSTELDAAIATFDDPGKAWAAANAAMPRRKHNRPYVVGSGYYSHRAGHDVWIVIVGNIALMRDGTMYDCQRERTIGR